MSLGAGEVREDNGQIQVTNKWSNVANRIAIEPITRLEGHGKIEIFLDNNGNVEKAFLQVPEFRGFEKFCEGRPAEEMPRIVTRLCEVCPWPHHLASTNALDKVFNAPPPPAAQKIRELGYCAHMLESHLEHVYALGPAPDFLRCWRWWGIKDFIQCIYRS